MNEVEHAKEWVTFAQLDLQSAQVLLNERIFNEVCFHSQQCVEKVLKACLVSQGTNVPRTHRLIDILQETLERYTHLDKFLNDCLILDQYYIPTRYPDAVIGIKPSGLPSQEDAEEAVRIAQTIFSEVQQLILRGR